MDTNIIARNKELCEKMPFLIPRDPLTEEVVKDYDYSYIVGVDDLPPGWEQLFLQLCQDLYPVLVKYNFLQYFRFAQVKEKFGQMRCYTFSLPDKCYKEISELIANYEYLSRFVCQRCGKPTNIRTLGWIKTLCKECLDDDIKEFNTSGTEYVDGNPDTRSVYSYKLKTTRIIDLSDIWQRYLQSIIR